MKRLIFFIILISASNSCGLLYAMEPALPIGSKIPHSMYLLIMAAQLEEQCPKKPKIEFPCTWPGCTKISTSPEFQKVHMRVHTDERPYACTAAGCEDRFKQLAHLNAHIRIHTNEKPYTCRNAHCTKAFRTSTARNTHEKTAHRKSLQKN
jgi:hypothetical protein